MDPSRRPAFRDLHPSHARRLSTSSRYLAEIACQSRDQRFLIGEGWTWFEAGPSEVRMHSLIEVAGSLDLRRPAPP